MIKSHHELDVYHKAFEAAHQLFVLSKSFPKEETYSLVDQLRRSSRSVCANLAEAWRKRRYPLAFVSKLTDSEGEAAEAQVWIQFAVDCGYVTREDAAALFREYEEIIRMLVAMVNSSDKWCYSQKTSTK